MTAIATLSALPCDGYDVASSVLSAAVVSELITVVEAELFSDEKRGGVRNLLSHSRMKQLVESEAIRGLVTPVLGEGCFPVRGILFDKTADANWKVPWHQDVTIAVQRRVDVAGFGPWSVKDGVMHVQPPAHVLEGMLTLRLHLDACPAENGALKVLPGSHLRGKIGEVEIAAMGQAQRAAVCEVAAGGVLRMFPLLVHASSACATPTHRRVLHFDFAAAELPNGLLWAGQG